jgi:FkbM family methyltransferase
MPLAKGLAEVAPLTRFLGRPLVVVDAGCRWGFADTWRAFGRGITVIGFDPDEAECRRLQALAPPDQDLRFVPSGLGARSGPATLHKTVEPACSSLYPPDRRVIRHRPINALCTPAGTARVTLTTLDDWARQAGVRWVDGIKLDTQGADLDILKGASRLLSTMRVLEIEVMFNPLYEGQPLFGDVDRYLRDRGFVLWRLGNLVQYGMAGARSDFCVPDRQYFDSRPVEFPAQGGQSYWGHAYFVPDDLAFGEPTADWAGCLRDACMATAFGFRDLAGDALRRALPHAPAEAARAIEAALEP